MFLFFFRCFWLNYADSSFRSLLIFAFFRFPAAEIRNSDGGGEEEEARNGVSHISEEEKLGFWLFRGGVCGEEEEEELRGKRQEEAESSPS